MLQQLGLNQAIMIKSVRIMAFFMGINAVVAEIIRVIVGNVIRYVFGMIMNVKIADIGIVDGNANLFVNN